jgi:hypothetical protein
MKRILHFLFLPVLLLVVTGGFEVLPYNTYEPVFMLRSEMEKNVKLEEPRSIKNAGKIYLKDHLIFINEKYKGIHVIDNSVPETPVNIAFIKVDGCIDMAISQNVLYADNAVDLIALKLNEGMKSIEVVKRIKNVFPEPVSPDGRSLTWREQQAIPDNAILVRWETK